MNNKRNTTSINNVAASANHQFVTGTLSNQATAEKYRNQFTGLAIDMGIDVLTTIKDNSSDYKAINEDGNMSSVDKALYKRELLAYDIALGTLGAGSVLGLIWIAGKIFVA